MNDGHKKFVILKGLPPYGNPAEQFSWSGEGEYREGLVVEFKPKGLPDWIGNFQRGGTNQDYIVEHPNSDYCFVIAGGNGYVVDMNNRKLIEKFGEILKGFIVTEKKSEVIHNNSTDLIAYGAQGQLWQTKRLAWDGIRNMKLQDQYIYGEALDVDDHWVPFRVNLKTGESTGGAFENTSTKTPNFWDGIKQFLGGN